MVILSLPFCFGILTSGAHGSALSLLVGTEDHLLRSPEDQP